MKWIQPISTFLVPYILLPYSRMQNTGTPRTSEHRQLKSHGNSLNCHGKVMKLYYQIQSDNTIVCVQGSHRTSVGILHTDISFTREPFHQSVNIKATQSELNESRPPEFHTDGRTNERTIT